MDDLQQKCEKQYVFLQDRFRDVYARYLMAKRDLRKNSMSYLRTRCTKMRAELKLLGWILDKPEMHNDQRINEIVDDVRKEFAVIGRKSE